MAQVKDPVCGMMVDSETADWKSTHDDDTYYFCMEQCKTSFDADPTEYIGDNREGREPAFTVEDGMTAPKFGSAGSGGAEYEGPPEQR